MRLKKIKASEAAAAALAAGKARVIGKPQHAPAPKADKPEDKPAK
jgi:hypothetical protein